jgi:hypothetical protein
MNPAILAALQKAQDTNIEAQQRLDKSIALIMLLPESVEAKEALKQITLAKEDAGKSLKALNYAIELDDEFSADGGEEGE